jgi:hypothetical protein
LKFARSGFAITSGQYKASTGREAPDWFFDQPTPERGDDLYLDGFWELSSCRDFGMGVGPIPWDKIVQYARWVKLEPDLEVLFVRIIRELDEVYLRNCKEKRDGGLQNRRDRESAGRSSRDSRRRTGAHQGREPS